MKYLVDTNLLIDFLKNKSDAVEKLQFLFEDGVALSIITVAEYLQGAYRLKNPKPAVELFMDFIRTGNIEIIDVDWEVAEKYAFLQARFEINGQRIPVFDLLIASTALVNNLILISDDKIFNRIPKLKM